MRVLFAVTAGPHQGEVFRFAGHDTFIVGRSKRAHFRLPDKDEYFSRVHFLVEVNPPHCRLMDMGSTNGTYVNGQRVTTTDLRHGDLIQGGQTVLRVTVEEEDGSEVATRAGLPPPAAAPGQTLATRPLPRPAEAPPTRAGAAGPGSVPTAEMGDTLSSPPHPEQPFPGYRVVRELGRGGMGIVYLAQRLADGKPVALKTIKPAGDAGDEAVQRFLREADVLRQLDHPNVVAFRELGQAGGRLFFVMDYVEGRDAAALLRESGPWPVARAVGVVGQLLDALQYAHDRGFVHRDVKPHNLLLAQEGGREAARLADFGLARVYQASRLSGLTMTGQIGGTMAFMAPEQITSFRESRPPVDQYAAAATLYNLLSGRLTHDFPSSSQERLLMILQAAPVPLAARRPDLPAGLAEVIHRALAKEPAARFASAAAFRQALASFGG